MEQLALTSLDDLVEECLRLRLIDRVEMQGPDVTLVVQGAVRYRLKDQQVPRFLSRILNDQVMTEASFAIAL